MVNKDACRVKLCRLISPALVGSEGPADPLEQTGLVLAQVCAEGAGLEMPGHR